MNDIITGMQIIQLNASVKFTSWLELLSLHKVDMGKWSAICNIIGRVFPIAFLIKSIPNHKMAEQQVNNPGE